MFACMYVYCKEKCKKYFIHLQRKKMKKRQYTNYRHTTCSICKFFVGIHVLLNQFL